MEEYIAKACEICGVQECEIMRRHAFLKGRNAKTMLWHYLVVDKGFSRNAVSKRFGCNRRNVDRVVRSTGDAMRFIPRLRTEYIEFAAKMDSAIQCAGKDIQCEDLS